MRYQWEKSALDRRHPSSPVQLHNGREDLYHLGKHLPLHALISTYHLVGSRSDTTAKAHTSSMSSSSSSSSWLGFRGLIMSSNNGWIT